MWQDIYTIDANTGNNQTGMIIDRFVLDHHRSSKVPYKLAVDENHIYLTVDFISPSSVQRLFTFPRRPIDKSHVDYITQSPLIHFDWVLSQGLSVIGETMYILNNPRLLNLRGLIIGNITTTYRHIGEVLLPRSIQVPFSVLDAQGLDIPV